MNIKYGIAGFLLTLLVGGGIMTYSWLTSETEIEDEGVSDVTKAPYEIEKNGKSTEVKEEYESLMTEAESRIRQLEQEAMEDMNGDTSYMKLYQKYSTAAKELEANTDETFDHIHSDLLEQGKEEEAAVLKQQYEEQKKEWRQSIVEEVKERL